MTTTNEGSISKNNADVLSLQENVCVPRQLIEVNELLNSINRRLEDCALEWQAEISRKQWKIFNSNTIEDNNNIPDKSLLARTYFTDKKFDEAFQDVLSCNKMFTKYIRDFAALLRREESIFDEKGTCEPQTQSYNTVENRNNKFNDSKIESLYFPLLRNQHLSGTRKTKNNIVENTSIDQNSLADVIEAKINFDKKFLAFEAVLHKIFSLTTSTNISYICRYCSKILKNSHGRRKKSMTVAQRHRIIAKSERVTRSGKLLSKNKERKLLSVKIGDADRSVVV